MAMVKTTGGYPAPRADIGKALIALVLLVCLPAALPHMVSVGGVSLLGLLSAAVAATMLIGVATNPALGPVTARAAFWLLLFWLYDLLGFAWQPMNLAVAQDNIVWGGFLFTILFSAHVARVSPDLVEMVAAFKWPAVAASGLLMGAAVLFDVGGNAATLLALWPCAQLVADSRSGRAADLIVVLLLLLGMAWLGARIAVGAVLMMLFLLQAVEGRWSNPFRKLSRILAGVAVVIGLFIAASLYISRFRSAFLVGDQAFEIGGIAINTSGRLYWWNVIYDYALEHPWLGWGLDVPTVMEHLDRWSHPHNDYLRLFHHLGLIGLSLWLLFYFRVWRLLLSTARYLWRVAGNRAESRVVYAAFLYFSALAVTMVTDNTIVYSFIMFPLGVYLGVSLGLMDRLWAASVAAGESPSAIADPGAIRSAG